MSYYCWRKHNGLAPSDIPEGAWMVDLDGSLRPSLLRWSHDQSTMPGFSGSDPDWLAMALYAALKLDPPFDASLHILWSETTYAPCIVSVRLVYLPPSLTIDMPMRDMAPAWAMKVMPAHRGSLANRLLPVPEAPPTAYEHLLEDS